MPIPRMGRAPRPHPLDMGRPTEVVTILGFREPAALTRGLARLPAAGLRAVSLMPEVTSVRLEEFSTMPALTSSFALHRPTSPLEADHHVETPGYPGPATSYCLAGTNGTRKKSKKV